MPKCDVGSMHARIEILTLTQEPDGCRWAAAGMRWGEVSYPKGRSLFSSVGIGVRAVRVRLRRVPALTLGDALRYRGQHLFLTRLDETPDGLYQTIEAAAITPVPCTVTRRRVTTDKRHNRPTLGTDSVYRFPACLTEKYIKATEETPQTTTEAVYVLVTPKCVTLAAGETVTVGGEPMCVQVGHTLDPAKNEYEVMRKEDA